MYVHNSPFECTLRTLMYTVKSSGAGALRTNSGTTCPSYSRTFNFRCLNFSKTPT